MSIDSLKSLLCHELQDLYSAETQLLNALPKMAEAVADAKLKAAFEKHLAETESQVTRLEEACKLLKVKPDGRKCKAMEGLVKEADDILKEEIDASVLDAALIAAAQRVEHYEIAGYGTARTFAEQLDLPEVAELMQQTLNEESAADEKLSRLAMRRINLAAV